MEEGAPGKERLLRPERALPSLAFVLGGALSTWLGGYVHHDTLPVLTRVVSAPAWLQDANGYPIEAALLFLVRALPGDPRLWWNLLGCAHLAALVWLLARVARRVFPGSEWPVWVVPLLALASPFTLRTFSGLNSVAQLTLCLLFWSERTLAESSRGRRIALGLAALSRIDGFAVAAMLAAVKSIPFIRERRWKESLFECCAPCGALLVYPFLWKLLLGEWTGLQSSLHHFAQIMGLSPLGPIAMARWLLSTWLEVIGSLALPVAIAGAALLIAERRSLLALLAPAVAIHLLLTVNGVSGSPIDARYLSPVLPYAALWTVHAAARAGERVAAPRMLAGWVVAALFVAGTVRAGTRLDALRTQHAVIRVGANAIARCFDELVADRPTLLVVPGGVRGDAIYALADMPHVAGVVFEKAYVFEPERYAGMPTLWFTTERFAGAAAAAGGRAVPCTGYSGPAVYAFGGEG